MAAALAGDRPGELHDPHGGRADLEGGAIRVLHDAQLRRRPDAAAARGALRGAAGLRARRRDRAARPRGGREAGAPGTVSGPRIRDELLDLLARARGARRGRAAGRARHRPGAASRRSAPIPSWSPAASSERPRPAPIRRWRRWPRCARPIAEPRPWIGDLGLDAGDARRACCAPRAAAPELAALLRAGPARRRSSTRCSTASRPRRSRWRSRSARPAEPVLRFVADCATSRLEISGDDLLAAGVPESPAIGARARRDAAAQARRRGRAAARSELRAALELRAGGARDRGRPARARASPSRPATAGSARARTSR